jgi:hypothetical protein
MLKTGFTKLVASVIIAIVLFVCSACSEAPSLQPKVAADPVTNTLVATTSDITTTPPVISAPFIP